MVSGISIDVLYSGLTNEYSNAAARRTALRYDAGDANLILVNYELAGSVLEDLTELVQRDTLLVFDEIHKVKKVGGEYAAAALELARHAAALVAMTGTPIPNSYLDVYNLLHSGVVAVQDTSARSLRLCSAPSSRCWTSRS